VIYSGIPSDLSNSEILGLAGSLLFVGDPLLAGVGPGAWAQRADVPDMEHGEPKIVPLH
jgi:photosynthetic reaction center H subunit